MSSPQEWFASLPPVTRYFFAVALATTILYTLNIVDTYGYFYMDVEKVFKKFQIWRLVTSFFFFDKFGIGFLIQMMFLTRYFGQLERGYFAGVRGTADCLWFCVVCGVLLHLTGYVMGRNLFGFALVFCALYVWSRKEPQQQVNLYGFAILAWHFPFVILVLAILGLGDPVSAMQGILVGHCYHFLTDIVPAVYGRQIVKTPEWLYAYIDRGTIPVPRQGWQASGGYSMVN